jgi:hypothetical protein
MTSSKVLLLSLAIGACREASSAERESYATVSGRAQFADTDHDREGSHRDVDVPAGQRGSLRIVLRGSGTLDADCADAAAGQFTAHYDGALAFDGNGEFSAPIYPSAPPVFTPSQCQVRAVDSAQIADLEITSELAASSESCNLLCDGRGRALGEERCQQSSDQAGCRVPIATSMARRCAATCLSSASGIIGRGWLDGTTISSVDGADLMVGKIGDIRAHLTFDQMIDANRKPLE